jgi:hypothetical protein
MADKATVPQVKAYFGEGDSGKAVTARDLIDLKKAPSVAGHASAYDDLAFGIGDGSLSY